MEGIQLALFPRSAVTGPRVHPGYRNCTPCLIVDPEPVGSQVEELPFEQDGDDR